MFLSFFSLNLICFWASIDKVPDVFEEWAMRRTRRLRDDEINLLAQPYSSEMCVMWMCADVLCEPKSTSTRVLRVRGGRRKKHEATLIETASINSLLTHCAQWALLVLVCA